jgi:hypothetical protein
MRRGNAGEARRAASRARRQGARVLEATTRSRWDAYARLYRDCVRRWERPLVVYRASLFSFLAGLRERGVRLWLAELDGEPCAGAIVLTHRGYATYWHGASMPERCPGAGNLLHWELLGRLVDEGFATCDLNGSGPLHGVVHFKESLGAERMPVIAYERRHPLEDVASGAKRLLTRRAR